jgi:endonuclease YncB( thermonuclease family)
MEHETPLTRPYSIKPLVFPLTLMLGVGLVVGRWTAAEAVAPDWAEQIHQAALLEANPIGGEDLVGPCQVTRVIDGEKLDLECNREQSLVRLLHLDGPERGERGYWEAALALWTLVDGDELYLSVAPLDSPSAGRQHRLLAYVVDGDGRNLNLEMVRQGWTRFAPAEDDQFLFSFAEAELEARQSRRGIWGH